MPQYGFARVEATQQKIQQSNYKDALVHTGVSTASGNQADFIHIPEANAVIVRIVVNAVSGTAPALTVSLQDSSNDSSWVTEGTSAGISAVGTYNFISTKVNPDCRISWVIGGTTPSFTFDVYLTPFQYGVGA